MNKIQLVFLTFLIAAAWQDLHKRSVSVWLYLSYGIGGAVLRLSFGSLGFMNLGGLLVGVAFLIIGWFSEGRIGSGDGWFFVVSGLYLNLFDTLRLLFFGVLWSGLFCLFVLLHGRMHGKNMLGAPVPFLPFLIPAWIGMVIL